MGKGRWIYNYWENNGTAGDVPMLSNLWKQMSKTAHQDSINEYWKTQVINDSLIKIFKADFIKSPPLKNKTVKILWNNRINGELINKEYFKTMSEPERAAIGYITKLRHTSENRDDKYTIENSLNLGYPCLGKYKCYMQLWFRNDAEALKTIVDCVLWDDGGQSVYAFLNEINLTVKGNKIYISLVNITSNRDIWDCIWTEEIIFLVDKDNIKVMDWKRPSEENDIYVYYYPNNSGYLPPPGYKDDGTGAYRLVKKSKKK